MPNKESIRDKVSIVRDEMPPDGSPFAFAMTLKKCRANSSTSRSRSLNVGKANSITPTA